MPLESRHPGHVLQPTAEAHTVLVDAFAKQGNLDLAEEWMIPIHRGYEGMDAFGEIEICFFLFSRKL